MTSYDVVWRKFVNMGVIESDLLPTVDEDIYGLIHEGVDYYNSFEDLMPISCNDNFEQINATLDSNRVSILSNCLAYKFLENQVMIFESVWSPLSSDIGVKFYKDQRNNRQDRLNRIKSETERLIEIVATKEYLGL